MTAHELRKILRNPLSAECDRFLIIKNVAHFIEIDETIGQEFLLRILSRINDFNEYRTVIEGLTRKVGLFPYLDLEKLSFQDSIAYEIHRPDGVDNVVFHHAQAEVYYSLLQKENIILSAPTSFGKSLIIDSIIASNNYSNIVIIVPTISLIDETRKRLSKFKKSFKLITHPSQDVEDKNIFILTQERSLELIPRIDVDFFVIDEFYKLSPQRSDEERCYILNKVFYSLIKKGAQFYLLGPNIERITTDLLDKVKYKFIKTDFKTVVSEKHNIKISENQKSIDRLLQLCLSLDKQTLIFCQSPASANKVANAFLESRLFEKIKDNNDLSEWLKYNYHPEWILPNCLEHGIGIHHGKIPRAIAQKCINLFDEGKIKFLICTSTLIEGVNTKAKNVIIYDNKIARNKFDYFTFNNICGRSGRMFSHFIGNIYLFHEPPVAELPSIEFPVFSQSDDVPNELLINIDDEDLKDNSKNKLKKYFEQKILSKEVLQRNSWIDLDKQIKLSEYIDKNISHYYPYLKWDQYPNNNQLKLACILIWNILIDSKKMIYGVSSGKQLHFRINQYRQAGNIKQFISVIAENKKTREELNDSIELAFDIQRYWINFQFPRFLKSLGDIANCVFKKNNLELCDYSYFANLVECYFMSTYVIPLDEYGLPIPISCKIGNILTIPSNIDEALVRLKSFKPKAELFSNVEYDFIREFQKFI